MEDIPELINKDTAPDELSFKYFVESGDFKKVVVRLRKEGYKNSLGKQILKSNVVQSVWRYCWNNPQETKVFFDKDLANQGKSPLDEDTWNIFIIKKWMQFHHNAYAFPSFKEFIEKNHYEKYYETFRIRYPEYARKCSGEVPLEVL
jgi:hypothetical protein